MLGPPIVPDDLQRLDSVQSARAEGDGYALTVTAPHRAIPALLDHLESTGHGLARLTTRQVSLEDVFVSLTGRHLRDDEAGEPKAEENGRRRRKRRAG